MKKLLVLILILIATTSCSSNNENVKSDNDNVVVPELDVRKDGLKRAGLKVKDPSGFREDVMDMASGSIVDSTFKSQSNPNQVCKFKVPEPKYQFSNKHLQYNKSIYGTMICVDSTTMKMSDYFVSYEVDDTDNNNLDFKFSPIGPAEDLPGPFVSMTNKSRFEELYKLKTKSAELFGIYVMSKTITMSTPTSNVCHFDLLDKLRSEPIVSFMEHGFSVPGSLTCFNTNNVKMAPVEASMAIGEPGSWDFEIHTGDTVVYDSKVVIK